MTTEAINPTVAELREALSHLDQDKTIEVFTPNRTWVGIVDITIDHMDPNNYIIRTDW